MDPLAEKPYFEIATPLGFSVRVTRTHWDVIVSMKHPVMAGREGEVQETLSHPDQVRQSQRDAKVYLFYRLIAEKRWVCVVVKRLNANGFIITTYPTDAIKEGERIWPR